jgi:HAMP domain-containing protein/putative methionine-R-sulfoxide reductase with GAF domain
VLSILVVGVASLLLGLSLVYFVGKSTLKRTIGANFEELADVTAKKLDELISHHVERAVFLAGLGEVVDAVRQGNAEPISPSADMRLQADWPQLGSSDRAVARVVDNPAANAFRSMLRMSGDQTVEHQPHEIVIAADAHGRVVAATGKPSAYMFNDAAWWREAYASGQGRLFLSDVFKDEGLGRYVFIIATPVRRDGRVEGVLAMVHDAQAFYQWVTSIQVGRTDHTMLVASDGTLLFCPVFPIKSHTLHPTLVASIVSGGRGWGTTTHDVHYPGAEAINGFAPVRASTAPGGNFGGKVWYIFTSQDPKETYGPIYTLLGWIIFSGAAAIGLLILLGLAAAKRIVRPIRIVQSGAQVIGNGNLNHRIHVETDDEIGALARGINEMAAKLSTSYNELERMVEERTRTLAQRTSQLEQRNQELFLLHAIGSSLNKAQSLDDVLGELLNKVLGGVEAHAVFIGLAEPGRGISPLQGRPQFVAAQDDMVHLAQSVVQRALTIGDLVVVPDTGTDPAYQAFSRQAKSLVGIPLRAKDKTLGAIVLVYLKPRVPTPEEREFLSSIGHQAGVVIENARLFGLFKNLAGP